MTAAIDSSGTDVLEKVHERAEIIASNAEESERLGCLTQASAEALRSTGVVRMTQPRDFGGFESHPVDYLRAVIEIGTLDSSAGWVAGVVGVHPHGLAHGHRALQEELWSEDPDTWIASPYAPMGRARPVEGGYEFSGQWPFSSGTDHCTWVVIGGMVVDDEGAITDPVPKHFVLPRSDYEILHDSWDVMGLRATGSKDIVVLDMFVPEHRVIDTAGLAEGLPAHDPSRADNPLYRMPRNVVFQGAICAGTLAAAQGTLAAYVAWTRNRENRAGKSSMDAYQLAALGAAAADIDLSILHLLTDVERVYDTCVRRETVSLETRLEVRRNQVAASHRAVAAADSVFKLSGGGSLQMHNALQRQWRGAQAALHHAGNQAGYVYQAYGLNMFGHPIPDFVKV
jgi:alkylation response protein AidB-like acyl-CoA dehydrogenase